MRYSTKGERQVSANQPYYSGGQQPGTSQGPPPQPSYGGPPLGYSQPQAQGGSYPSYPPPTAAGISYPGYQPTQPAGLPYTGCPPPPVGPYAGCPLPPTAGAGTSYQGSQPVNTQGAFHQGYSQGPAPGKGYGTPATSQTQDGFWRRDYKSQDARSRDRDRDYDGRREYITLPKFNGKDVPWELFAQQFRSAADVNNWQRDPRLLKARLLERLTGEAGTLAASLPYESHFDVIYEALRDRYQPSTGQEVARGELENAQ